MRPTRSPVPLVTRYEEELARVVSQAGPVTGRVPTMPGAAPVHSAETVTGPAFGPGHASSPGRRPGLSRRTVVSVIAAAVAVGVLGAFALRAVQDDGEPGNDEAGGGSASPSASATAADRAVGLDQRAANGSRYFPVDTSARPDGWEPWTVKLPGRPKYCALNPEVLVCRTVDGGMVAVDAADGGLRWEVPTAEPGKEAAAILPWPEPILPGTAKEPLIYGDMVISYASGKVRARALSDGTARWERSLPSGSVSLKAPPLVGGGAVFVTSEDREGVGVHAFDADTGDHLWRRTLSDTSGTSTIGSYHRAWTFAGGRILGTSDGGLMGFDARTGKVTHFAAEGGCGSVWTADGDVVCGSGDSGVVLDAKTLRPVGGAATPAPLGDWSGSRALDDSDSSSVVFVEDTPYLLGSADKGERIVLQAEGERFPRTVVSFPDRPMAVEPTSVPVIVGDRAMVADNQYLHTLPVDGGSARKYRLKDAPGSELRIGGDGFGTERWPPQLISLGGVLYLVFHDGTVRSFEIPKP